MVSNMALLSKVINVELVKEFVVMDEEVGEYYQLNQNEIWMSFLCCCYDGDADGGGCADMIFVKIFTQAGF